MATTHDTPRSMLTVPEIADRLRVSVTTVRRRIESGELPAVRIGSGTRAPVRVDVAELDVWLHEGSRDGGGPGRDMASVPGPPAAEGR